MPRYMVQRTFPDGLASRSRTVAPRLRDRRGAQPRGGRHLGPLVRERGQATTFCVYDAPTPEAVRKSASRNDLPVDQITEVRVLDPYFYV